MIRGLLVIVVIFALAAAGPHLWHRLDQPIRVVRVEGSLSLAEQQAIQTVCHEALVAGVLSIDLEELTERIYDLSWPRDVRVRRLWPDALLIQVEREPVVAVWGSNAFLTSAGKVVHLHEWDAATLPRLSAEFSTPRQTMQTYQLLQEQLRPSGLVTRALQENALGEWLLTLDNGISVALGNQFLPERVERFLLLYHRVLAERMPEPAYVDTRYENGIAVRRSEPMLAREEGPQQQQIQSRIRHGL
jgi:cell division protein FtsQ